MDDCIFCKIINRQIPSNIVYEDEEILAFRDINPVAPVHILLIPKKHIISLADIELEDEKTIGKIHSVIKELAKRENINESGFRVVSNCGSNGGQIVPHLHFHLIGGKALGSKICH